MLIENLKDMEWVLPMTTLSEEDRKEFGVKVMEEIHLEYQNG